MLPESSSKTTTATWQKRHKMEEWFCLTILIFCETSWWSDGIQTQVQRTELVYEHAYIGKIKTHTKLANYRYTWTPNGKWGPEPSVCFISWEWKTLQGICPTMNGWLRAPQDSIRRHTRVHIQNPCYPPHTYHFEFTNFLSYLLFYFALFTYFPFFQIVFKILPHLFCFVFVCMILFCFFP